MMGAEKGIFQHVSPEERAFVEKLLDLVARLERDYVIQLTGFLDPRQLTIAQNVLRHEGVTFYVGYEQMGLEYVRVLLAPDYYQLDTADFELALVEIYYQSKFTQLTHSQILGTLLNHLGLKRQVIGDILIADGRAQVVLERPLVPFILANTEKIARAGVRLKEVPWSDLLIPKADYKEDLVLVSSLRLDKVLAAVYRLSRQEAQNLVAAGKVKVNYQVLTKPDYQLTVGDLISCRGFGRVNLVEEKGFSKQGKQKLLIQKTIKR